MCGDEHTPASSEVEPINLEYIIDFAGDRDARAYVPAPAGLVAEGSSCCAGAELLLGAFTKEPGQELLELEKSGPVLSFPEG